MDMSTVDWVGKWAIYRPGKLAVKEFESGRSWTYAELNTKANTLLAYGQNHWGLNPGDRIAVMAQNCLEYFQLFSMAQKGGLTLVPLNYRLATAELEYLLEDAQPSLLISERAYFAKMEGVAKASGDIRHIYLEDLQNISLADTTPDMAQPDPDDPIFILYTSGTTGVPKGVLYTHRMLFWNSVNTALSLIVNTDSRTVNCMPPFHTGGWNVLTTPFLHRGGYTCLLKKFDPERVLQAIEEEQTTIFMGVPTMLKMMADSPQFETVDTSQLLYMIVGGEAMSIPLIERWHEKGVPIRQGYGMTEVGPNLTSLHQDDAVRKAGSIGRANYYVQYRIVDAQGANVPPGESGELWLKGPNVTPGYWRKEDATRQSKVDGWFRTGDLVREDDGGYLYVVDRIKNMFISGGENVYPAEVERVLLSHQSIVEAAVIGIPDEKWGEVGCAFLVLTSEIELSHSEVINFCLSKLAKFKVPKYIKLLKELPKNDTGKIDRKALKKTDL
ncbi:MAG: long-chain fatty acid--CoA ligase [Bacteroidota bacterium]